MVGTAFCLDRAGRASAIGWVLLSAVGSAGQPAPSIRAVNVISLAIRVRTWSGDPDMKDLRPRRRPGTFHFTVLKTIQKPDPDRCSGGRVVRHAMKDPRPYLAVHWHFGILFLEAGFRPILGQTSPQNPLERRGSSCRAACTKNQPRRPTLRPCRGNSEILKSPPPMNR